MVMYFQVGALSLTVVHGSRAGHLEIFTADVQHEAPSVGLDALPTLHSCLCAATVCLRCHQTCTGVGDMVTITTACLGGGSHGNHDDCIYAITNASPM